MSDLLCQTTDLPGVMLLQPKIFRDPRGFFRETYHAEKFEAHGICCAFVQDNHSHSCHDALRGLHYQVRHPQAKLVSVIRGAIFDVVVDIRRDSPTFGRHACFSLSDENQQMVFIPEGFAHGFCVLSDVADVHYKCSDFYQAGDDGGIAWNDPALRIPWPVSTPVLSGKDTTYPRLVDIPADRLPLYRPH
ncbi:MAG: dTDP-4-dehydrorhamnose 3,5-epimerase [Kiritimatiellaeota bacterium]|nr:dTDP-4-dehydrorhamnose 3,5-epimerase [Kiritimatiellota bacterium]